MNIYTNNESKCEVSLKGLYEVLDPEIGLNIVDLGLIYQIDFDESNQLIDLTMTLTTQFCPMGDSIVSDTKKSLQKSFPGWEITIYLTFNPVWDFTMISEEGREYLGHI